MKPVTRDEQVKPDALDMITVLKSVDKTLKRLVEMLERWDIEERRFRRSGYRRGPTR